VVRQGVIDPFGWHIECNSCGSNGICSHALIILIQKDI
jgi:hypothetical protein